MQFWSNFSILGRKWFGEKPKEANFLHIRLFQVHDGSLRKKRTEDLGYDWRKGIYSVTKNIFPRVMIR